MGSSSLKEHSSIKSDTISSMTTRMKNKRSQRLQTRVRTAFNSLSLS